MLLRVLPLLLDEGREAIAVDYRTGGVHQVRGLEGRVEVHIQERAHAGRKHKRIQKVFSEPLAPQDEEIAITYAHG